MKAYKASYNGKCHSITYEVGKTYTYNGKLSMCNAGFHFCKNPEDVLRYYSLIKDLKVFEIEVLGKTIYDDTKSVTDKMKILRVIPFAQFNKLLKNRKYNKNRNMIYFKDTKGGIEYWYKYDKNNNMVYVKNSNSHEEWREYDKNRNLIHQKDTKGEEFWWEYNNNNKCTYYKNASGFEEKWIYDKKNNLIGYKCPTRQFEWSIEITK